MDPNSSLIDFYAENHQMSQSQHVPDLSPIVEYLQQGQPENTLSDHTVPEQTLSDYTVHEQMGNSSGYSVGYLDSSHYHFNGEPHAKRPRNSNSFSSVNEQADSLQSINNGLMEQYTNLNDINLSFPNKNPFQQIVNTSQPLNQGFVYGHISWSRQPAKHRPQYPKSEGPRGYVKSKDNRNAPTQIKFHVVEGTVTRLLAEIYHAEANRPSDDYITVAQKKKNGGIRSIDSFPIWDGSTHDLDNFGIQVKGVEERGNLKKRAKECRIKVTCSIRLNSGEEYQLSAISDKFNCSQDSNSQIIEIEPAEATREGGNLILIKGKNFKTDDSTKAVFEQLYGGNIVWQAEVKPLAKTKQFIVGKIPAYTGPTSDGSVNVSLSIQSSSSNTTDPVKFQYYRDSRAQFTGIKRESGVAHCDGAGSSDCGYSYNSFGTALSTQVVHNNGLLIPGNTE